MADTETVERANRSQMYKHEDVVGWLTDEGHISPNSTQAEVIAAFAANRNAYRKTDRYRNLVQSHASESQAASEARKAEREAAKEAKAAERAAAKEAKAAKEAATPAEPPTPAKATRKSRKAAAETTEDNPFG